MALWTVARAALGYLFLVLMVRIVGRRPGKQLTPFEFVLIFFLGGLTLTGMVGDELSLSNALCQITTVACCHTGLVWLRSRSSRLALITDGTPLILMHRGQWRARTMEKMQLTEADVLNTARDQGLASLAQVEAAILERNGEISLITASDA